MSCSLLELGNQEAAARLQHAIHLGNRSLLIIISNVVQSERAGDSVERALAERKLLGVPDLKAHRYAILERLCGGAADHLRARINAGYRAGRGYPFGEDPGKPAGTAADIENMITGPELQILGDHRAEPASASS